MKVSKKAQIEFNWLFALIVGAVILFLAIFFASRLIGTQRYLSETELVKNFDVLLNPFASVGGIGKVSLAKTIDMPQTVQINYTCDSEKITMRLRSESSTGKKWGEWSPPNYIYNKYIFSNSFMQAKRFDVFSQPLYLPFRIDDLIYILDKDYCFVNAPLNIKSELEGLDLTKIQFASSGISCKPASLKVCFDSSCDITVTGCSSSDCSGNVKKASVTVSYATSSLMYAAIFSEPKMYSCELSRLIARLKLLIDIYEQKAAMLSSQGCDTSTLQSKLEELKNAVSIESIYGISKEVSAANPAECPVF